MLEQDSNKAGETTVKRAIFTRPVRTTAFEVRVVDGVDAGLVITIDATTSSCLLIGRSGTCGLKLTDETVAARQCSLQLDGARLRMRDLASTASTRVNGVEVMEALLVGGEVLRVGDTVLSIVRRDRARGAGPRVTSFGRLRGESSAMCDLFPVFETLARDGRHVLVEGERGVGKHLLAEELHRLGHSAEGAPFVVFESRDIAAGSVDAVLFATGGLLEQAAGGTLFISELHALGIVEQQKLAAELERLGALPADARVRLIAGMRDARPALAAELVRCFEGTTGAKVALPPLRGRDGDLLVLATHFWQQLGGEGALPDDFTSQFVEHRWSGNVRELRVAVENLVHHGIDHAAGDRATARLAPRAEEFLDRVIAADLPMVEARHKLLAEFEKRYIGRALHRSGEHVGRAARASGVAVRYFQVLRSRSVL